MINMEKCKYCRREATRYYNKKKLCELHYLKENPDRNRTLVDWEKLSRMKMPTDDILFISNEKSKMEEN